MLEDKEWDKMLANFGVCYFDTKEERQYKTKGLIGNREFGLPFMIATMGAYGAWYYHDRNLAKKVWKTLVDALLCENGVEGFKTHQCNLLLRYDFRVSTK